MSVEIVPRPHPQDEATATLLNTARRNRPGEFAEPLTSATLLGLYRRTMVGEPGVAGRIRAIRARARSGDPTVRAAEGLLDWMVQVAQSLESAASTPAANPARVAGPAQPRPLSAADVAWISRLDPKALTDDDVRALAEMERDAASPGDLRLVRSVLAPRRRELDAVEEREALLGQVKAATQQRPERTKASTDAVVAFLAPMILEEQHHQVDVEVPDAEAREQFRIDRWEALRQAEEAVHSVWTGLAAEATAAAQAANTRLAELRAGAEPRTSAPSVVFNGPDRAGRDRARQVAERREVADLRDLVPASHAGR